MTEIQYEDFEIEVRSIAKKKYEVRVLKSPCGRATSAFIPPYPAEKLDEILGSLEGRVCASSRAARDMAWMHNPEPMAPLEVEELGRTLFRALFPRPVEMRLREALSIVHERAGDQRDWGLQVRITFDRAEDFALLATLPWEFLWDRGQFLNRHRLTPIVRSLNADVRSVSPMTGPLRVLLIPSSPRGVSTLDVDREAGLIRQALERNSGVEIVTMWPPDIRKLPEQANEIFHIVHFMGHGGILEGGRDEFVLYFEGEDRRAEPVKSLQFADYLRTIPGLRLVVLNSCWSGAFSRRGGQDPFRGVGAALIARGMPAVVAMQFPISDDAAIAFSRAFYERLAAKDSVSAAATMGRLAILDEEPDSLEWATPVVLLAGEDIRFDVRPAEPQQPAPPAGISASRKTESPEAIRLAIRSFRDPYLGDNQTPDDLLDLTPFFGDRRIKAASLWRAEVYPRLREFLLRYEKERTPLVLDLAAHLTIAFAAGYCLEAKSGLDVTLLQRTQRQVFRWKAEAGPARTGPLWQDEADLVFDSGSPAVAVAIGAAVPIVDDVKYYLQKSHRAVGRLVPATLYPQPSSTAVKDGLHALQLAQDLSVKIWARSVEERRRPLHVFAAAPNALVFFVGQLAKSFGPVQLYEHDFPTKKPGAYMPSLRLPVPP
jgi:hypothetical protein